MNARTWVMWIDEASPGPLERSRRADDVVHVSAPPLRVGLVAPTMCRPFDAWRGGRFRPTADPLDCPDCLAACQVERWRVTDVVGRLTRGQRDALGWLREAGRVEMTIRPRAWDGLVRLGLVRENLWELTPLGLLTARALRDLDADARHPRRVTTGGGAS